MTLPQDGIRPPTLRSLRSRSTQTRRSSRASQHGARGAGSTGSATIDLARPWRHVERYLADRRAEWDPDVGDVAVVRIQQQIADLACWSPHSPERAGTALADLAKAVADTLQYQFKLWPLGNRNYVGVISGAGFRQQTEARLSEALAQMTEMALRNDHTALVDFRVGMAFLGDRPTVERLADSGLPEIDCADQALAETSDDQPFVIYDSSVARRSAEAAALATDLIAAVDRNDIRLSYQARRTLGGPVVGVEALARWYHWQRGPMSNDELLSIAEQAGELPAMGRRLRLNAMQAAQVWSDTDLLTNREVYCNVAPVELCHRSFEPSLRELRRLFPTTELLLELPESRSLDLPVVRRVLHRLADQDCQFIIDGLHPMSLSIERLRHLPLAGLNLTGTFTKLLGHDKVVNRLAEAVVELADQRGLVVTATRVETEQQLAAARAYGVDQCQGDYFSPAVHAPRFAEAVEESNQRINRVLHGRSPSGRS